MYVHIHKKNEKLERRKKNSWIMSPAQCSRRRRSEDKKKFFFDVLGNVALMSYMNEL